MRKIVTSVGLLAMGASVLHAAESSPLNQMQNTKPWSIQATLNGFYDDNMNTSPAPGGIETTGFDISPSFKFGLPGEQTSFNLGYTFTARFYDKVPANQTDKDSLTHVFDLNLSHAFSPSADMSLSEAFAMGQEPDLLSDPAATQRYEGDNIRNFAEINFNVAATDLLGFGFGYKNSLYDYDDAGVGTTPAGGGAGSTVTRASSSGTLDRMEHLIRIDSNWKLSPSTIGVVGYNYSQTMYNGDEPIAGTIGVPSGLPGGEVDSDDRNSQGHTFYVGAKQVFSPTFSGYANVGAQYFTYYNSPNDDAQWSPYLQGGLTYALQEKTSLDAGISYSRQAANEVGPGGSDYVRDTENATLYGSLKHEIVSKLIGSANASATHAKYNGGGTGIDDEGYLFYQLGLDLAYEFNQYISGHVGYNYDKYDSTLPGPRDYDRNRVYAGVTVGF